MTSSGSRAAKQARRQAKAEAKEAARRVRGEAAQAKREEDRERREQNRRDAGAEALAHMFGLNRVALYENGYVLVINTLRVLSAYALDALANVEAADRAMKRLTWLRFDKVRSVDFHLERLVSIDVSTQIEGESPEERVVLLTIETDERIHHLRATGDEFSDNYRAASELEEVAYELLGDEPMGT